MLKKLNLDEFYTEENKKIDNGAGIGAVGLLTTHQFINVYNYEDSGIIGLGSHAGTYIKLLNEIYGLGIPDGKKGYPDLSEVDDRIPHCEKNFVNIQYVVQSAIDFVTVNIPYYITPFQYEELLNFNEIIKNYDVVLETIILHFDPIKGSYIDGVENVYYSTETSIIDALNYMKENNRVFNYELPFGEEKIIEQKKNHI